MHSAAIIFLFSCCLILSVIAISLTEALWHRFLFHNRSQLGRWISSIWNYDPVRHATHHKICREDVEDGLHSEESYWVQTPSNVVAGFVVAFVLECLLLFLICFPVWTYITTFFLTVLMFFLWYKFEDHFHLGMHKKRYYEENIQNTWQNFWFCYVKRCHAIHHLNPRYNLGFVFFPIGDLILGTYRHSNKLIFRKEKL